jgi:hypothetical protein
MSKDYKTANRPAPSRNGGAVSLMVGILFGLLLGLVLSLTAAWYIKKMPTSFLSYPRFFVFQPIGIMPPISSHAEH